MLFEQHARKEALIVQTQRERINQSGHKIDEVARASTKLEPPYVGCYKLLDRRNAGLFCR